MSYVHSGSVLFQKQRVLCAEHAQTKSAPKPLQNTLHGKRALGVTMNANMKVSEQCRIAASKGNQVLGMIRRNITYRYKEKILIIPLYKAIVRPHLEYCIQAWNPHLRKDVDMLEKIQRRATKLIPELRDLITRGHNYTLVKKQSRLDVRKFSFSQRTINVWNNLSTDCVHASSVNNV